MTDDLTALTDNTGGALDWNSPEGIIAPRDRAFLLAHLDEAKRIVNCEADDAHLVEA